MRIAGVDIGGTSIKIGIFDGDRLIHKDNQKTPADDAPGVCEAIARMLKGWQVDCVGVGTAGSVDPVKGTVFASNLGWEGIHLKDMLENALHVPVCVDNDAQAALLAEQHDGACKGAQCALYLTLGTGIGGAMIVDGKPYRGRNHLGAEFGHMIIRPDGPRCSCGRRGCLEYYASATGLRRMSNWKTTQEIIAGAKDGDDPMRRVFNRYIRNLCIGLNNLIMAFDPEVIVLGGGVSGAGDFLADHCQQELARIFSNTTDPLLCRVRIAHHKNDAGIIGAALLAALHAEEK